MNKINKNVKQSDEVFAKVFQKGKEPKDWEYYRNLIETSIDSLVTISPDGIITDVNSAAEMAFGLPSERIIGTDFSEYFTEPEKARIEYKKVFDIGKVVNYELYLKHINGSFLPVSYNASVYTDRKNQKIGALAVVRDISAIKKYENNHIGIEHSPRLHVQPKSAELAIANKKLAFQNKEKDKRLAELVLANKELLFQTGEKADRADELVIANKELAFQKEEKAKRSAELVLANKELLFQAGEKEDRAAELVIAKKELAIQNKEIDMQEAELHIANAEIIFQNEVISYISHHDFLTGLHNRIYFEEEKNRLDIPSQLPISIIMGDINGLKLVNDDFGHAKGNELLIILSKILKKCCRDEDIVSRIGGDEFGIILPQTDNKQAQQLCSRIADACNGYALHESLVYLSISLGYATKTISTETMNTIMMSAEEKMSMHKLLERKSSRSSIITSIKAIMFEKSQETEQHADRMVQLSKSIGLAMSLTEGQLHELELLSTLHDIGKMGISAEILCKPGKLNDKEWAEMRKHPDIGFRIAQATSDLIPIAEYILYHHERWDGKGYPEGLIGDKIPLLSRIVAIVDAFDAMTNDRSYRPAMTKKEAIEEIRRNSGTQFDPEVSKVFIKKVS